MSIVHRASELGRFAGGVLVPTMGYLHPGHVRLVAHAARYLAERRLSGGVIVSVFVNPTQFDEQHDYDRYPRDLERDAAMCFEAGADCVFAPEVDEVYPPDGSVTVPDLPASARLPGLEDTYRPGHFEGVCQVCKRLLELTGAKAAVFGEKDWQQYIVIRDLVEQEGMDVEIVPHPTVREEDGLAMSSRNVHLDERERKMAAALSAALEEARRHRDPAAAEAAGRVVLDAAGVVTEYLAVRDAETLVGPPKPGGAGRVLVAGRLGLTRLIDNSRW